MVPGWSSRTAMLRASTNATPNTSRRLEYQTVSRKRMLRAKAGSCTLEDVALSADGFDELLFEALVEFPAKVVHVHLHGLGEGVGVLVPDMLQELFLGHGAAFVSRQVIDQGELLGRQVDVLAVPFCPVGVRVEFETARVDHGLAQAAVPAGDGTDARGEFAEGERLDEVVVGAVIEAFDALLNRAAG